MERRLTWQRFEVRGKLNDRAGGKQNKRLCFILTGHVITMTLILNKDPRDCSQTPQDNSRVTKHTHTHTQSDQMQRNCDETKTIGLSSVFP